MRCLAGHRWRHLPWIFHNIIYGRSDSFSFVVLPCFVATRHAALIKSQIRGVSSPIPPLLPLAPHHTHLSSFLLSPCAPRATGFGWCWVCCLATACNWYLSCLLILYMCAASLSFDDDDDVVEDAAPCACACACAWTSATARQRKQHKLQSEISFYGLSFYTASFLWFYARYSIRD